MSNFSSRVAIVEINAPLRTDESFQNCIREYHHNGNSIFELLDFSVDPLNLVVVDLGGFRQLLLTWIPSLIKIWKNCQPRLKRFNRLYYKGICQVE